MDPERPLSPDRRRFKVTVKNGCGDEAVVTVDILADRSTGSYAGPVVLKARRIIPDEKPWKVGPWVEEAGPSLS